MERAENERSDGRDDFMEFLRDALERSLEDLQEGRYTTVTRSTDDVSPEKEVEVDDEN